MFLDRLLIRMVYFELIKCSIALTLEMFDLTSKVLWRKAMRFQGS